MWHSDQQVNEKTLLSHYRETFNLSTMHEERVEVKFLRKENHEKKG